MKIDLGAHLDGFIAVVAYTMVVGATAENKAKGRRADVILAAYNAAQATLRLVKEGKGVSSLIIFLIASTHFCVYVFCFHRITQSQKPYRKSLNHTSVNPSKEC